MTIQGGGFAAPNFLSKVISGKSWKADITGLSSLDQAKKPDGKRNRSEPDEYDGSQPRF